MEKRTIFDRLFGRYKAEVQQANEQTRMRLMSGFTPVFTQAPDDLYHSDVVRSAVHAIASNAAKLTAKHIIRTEAGIKAANSNENWLLSHRPNEHMNAYDFIYKMVTQRELQNNAFALIVRDETGKPTSFYPIDFSMVEFMETQNDEVFVHFSLASGRKLVVPYSDVVHLRKHFNKDDMFGESNSRTLLPTTELIHTSNEGIINAVKTSAYLRGLIKFTQSMLKPEDLKAQRDAFVKDYMSMENNGGIAALDSKAEYQELKTNPMMVDSKQMEIIESKVYKYFNINASIVQSDYTEDQWNAFYESVLEPIAIQLSLEFTSKLFSKNSLTRGHEIIFEANRLQYASATTKISLVRDLMPLGLFTLNEAREIFNLSPVEDGDKRIQTLNVVDASQANNYQGVSKAGKGGETDDENKTAADDGDA
ncbi:phage portal protein [Exiguobacterium sp. N5]|uniref:phage portal protein n=1 Tax=Exiguobacterium sp. N5 TaxID=2990450 RepID=UPI0021F4B62A|nr:phage portal protein [Exiguobacterium sp. N5]MCV9899835.1 phage portal protein [Exiguobacterium sp. N5]